MVFSLSSSTTFAGWSLECYSEAGVRYLEPQGEPHYEVAKISIGQPSYSIYLVTISRYEILPLYLMVDQMLYLSHLGGTQSFAQSLQQGRSSWDREDRARNVLPCFPHPFSYSRISGRDSCKGGRIVTALIWYPKIWAKFSLFVCIASWHPFKLLMVNKATIEN